METQESGGALVHSYDVERRAVRCGAVGATASTKHARAVTCPQCRSLLAAAEDGEPDRPS
jgi:hypothetical protein